MSRTHSEDDPSIELSDYPQRPSSSASVDSGASPEACVGKTDLQERQPLIPTSSSSSSSTPRHSCGGIYQASSSRPYIPRPAFAPADEDSVFDFIMEKVRDTKVGHYLDKLAVESEPGLTTAQLMLFNHDLKPVEPERRQWGPWNFVGFWVGMLTSPEASEQASS